jgi:anaerobic selenocysteine-containing dehydrogenase
VASDVVHTYCPMCVAQCGVVAVVENGRLTKIKPDPEHPNGGICIKGSAAPEIVYSSDRLLYPMKRTHPKGDADPGWVKISWEEALETVASRLTQIKAQSGPEAVVFACATPSGSSAADFSPWLTRLGNAFGTPNRLSAIHICTWNVAAGAKHTYGTPTPSPDYENARCILLWGANPRATFPTYAQRISQARAGGAKLIVIDPRKHNLARTADCWLQVRPGSDAALALAMIHTLIEEELFDETFVRDWTNGAFLVREDTQRLLTGRDLDPSGSPQSFVIWDALRAAPLSYSPDHGFAETGIQPAITGSYLCRLADGSTACCQPAFALLAARAAQFAPERSKHITWVPPNEVRRAARLFATERPSCYFSWAGLEMHSNAMQLNRAVCCFYSLTGQYDGRGSNVLMATTPTRPVEAPQFLPKEKAARRLGLKDHPLGPPNDPGHVQASRVYDAILTGQPYKIRAMVCFGGDPLLGQGNVSRGKEALAALEFYVHMDLFANPSASFADLLLPASTGWESEALKTGFSGQGAKGASAEASRWAQMRKVAVPPPAAARADLAVIFDIACRLGLDDHFFGGDLDAAWRYQLEPSGLTLEELRARPLGAQADVTTRYRKYADIEPQTAQPRGFATPSRKLELYSTRFANAGYDPLPYHEEPADAPLSATDSTFPLVLTSFRMIQFVDDQHRNIPRLRNEARDPIVEIHPDTATNLLVDDGEWVTVETAAAKIKLKAKYNDSLHPNVVCAPYGWWQGCKELALPAYDAFSSCGANVNLLISNRNIDLISASVPHRSSMCRVSKAAQG